MNYTHFSSNYRVSMLTANDVNTIYNLCAKNPLYYQFCPPFVTFESIIKDLNALPPNKTYDDKYYLGYFDNDNNLIAVMDFIDKYPNEQTCFIGFFMINSDYQGNGIGSSIISELCNYLSSVEYNNIRLGYVEGNYQSKAFWIKNGFVDTGLRNKTDAYTVVIMNKCIK